MATDTCWYCGTCAFDKYKESDRVHLLAGWYGEIAFTVISFHSPTRLALGFLQFGKKSMSLPRGNRFPQIWGTSSPIWHLMTSYDIIWHHTISFDVTWCYMKSYDATWYHIISYDTIWYDITSYIIWWDNIRWRSRWRSKSGQRKSWRWSKNICFQKCLGTFGVSFAIITDT